MATAREIRRRMASVGNIRQITRAMELIAVTRLRRAQARVLSSRPYAEKMREVLADVVERVDAGSGAGTGAAASADTYGAEDGRSSSEAMHPLLERRDAIRRVGVVVLTTDRGLCGALNSNVIRAALQFTYAQQNMGRQVELIVVGRKGLQMLRREPVTIVAEFSGLGDYPDLSKVAPIARVAVDAFVSRHLDEVVFVYPRFINTLRQDPTVVPFLPIQPPERAGAATPAAGTVGAGAATLASPAAAETPGGQGPDYIYEPSPRDVLAALLPRYVELQMYQAVLDLSASEFSAKMVAMRNATDNAGELLSDLRLGYNKARQATITREIIEVSAGAAAGN